MGKWTAALGLALCACGDVGPEAMSGSGGSGTTDADSAPGGDTSAADGDVPSTNGNADADTGGSPPMTSTDGAVDDSTSATDPDTSAGDTSSETGSPALPEDCAAVLLDDPEAPSGVYDIDPPGVGPIAAYCDMETDGGGWTRFWWWTPGKWPAETTDVLADAFGTCAPVNPYCFGRLPGYLTENTTSLLAIDPQAPTKYRWDFDADNNTAHAAWQAFAEHLQIPSGAAQHGDAWMPMALEGSSPPDATQDSFMYRTEHGVASVLMDDDNCDCYTSLQMGHGMCYGGWGTGSSPEDSYGVDRLYDPDFEDGPRPEYHLELFYR